MIRLMAIALVLSLLTCFFVLPANAGAYFQIQDLENPYPDKLSNIDISAKEDIRLHGLNDQFEFCKSGLINSSAFAFLSGIQYTAVSKYELFKQQAENMGAEYPFSTGQQDPRELVYQLSMNKGWQYKTDSLDKGAFDQLAQDFWGKCLAIPLSYFEAEWIDDGVPLYDKDGYDEDGYDREGFTREENDNE